MKKIKLDGESILSLTTFTTSSSSAAMSLLSSTSSTSLSSSISTAVPLSLPHSAMELMPPEIYRNIIKYLGVGDRCKYLICSREIRLATDDEESWRDLFQSLYQRRYEETKKMREDHDKQYGTNYNSNYKRPPLPLPPSTLREACNIVDFSFKTWKEACFWISRITWSTEPQWSRIKSDFIFNEYSKIKSILAVNENKASDSKVRDNKMNDNKMNRNVKDSKVNENVKDSKVNENVKDSKVNEKIKEEEAESKEEKIESKNILSLPNLSLVCGGEKIEREEKIKLERGEEIKVGSGEEIKVKYGEESKVKYGEEANVGSGEEVKAKGGEEVKVKGGEEVRVERSHTEDDKEIYPSSSVCVSGELDLDPKIYIPSLDLMMKLPLDPKDLVKILENTGSQAPMGRGTKTILDVNSRKCWQLDTSQFVITNSRWNKLMTSNVSTDSPLRLVYETLIANPEDIFVNMERCKKTRVVALPYKLLIYREGDFFKPHVDTQRSPAMFGTLTINLPVASPIKSAEIDTKVASKRSKTDADGTDADKTDTESSRNKKDVKAGEIKNDKDSKVVEVKNDKPDEVRDAKVRESKRGEMKNNINNNDDGDCECHDDDESFPAEECEDNKGGELVIFHQGKEIKFPLPSSYPHLSITPMSPSSFDRDCKKLLAKGNCEIKGVRNKNGKIIEATCYKIENLTSTWVAFFTDCLHEVRPVVSGYRVSLIYNLFRINPPKSNKKGNNSKVSNNRMKKKFAGDEKDFKSSKDDKKFEGANDDKNNLTKVGEVGNAGSIDGKGEKDKKDGKDAKHRNDGKDVKDDNDGKNVKNKKGGGRNKKNINKKNINKKNIDQKMMEEKIQRLSFASLLKSYLSISTSRIDDDDPNHIPRKPAWFLSHKYSDSGLAFRFLKGNDAQLYRAIRALMNGGNNGVDNDSMSGCSCNKECNCNHRMGFHFTLANVVILKGDKDSNDFRVCRPGDEKEEGYPFTIDDQFIWMNPSFVRGLKPYDFISHDSGNEGAMASYLYRNTILILDCPSNKDEREMAARFRRRDSDGDDEDDDDIDDYDDISDDDENDMMMAPEENKEEVKENKEAKENKEEVKEKSETDDKNEK